MQMPCSLWKKWLIPRWLAWLVKPTVPPAAAQEPERMRPWEVTVEGPAAEAATVRAVCATFSRAVPKTRSPSSGTPCETSSLGRWLLPGGRAPTSWDPAHQRWPVEPATAGRLALNGSATARRKAAWKGNKRPFLSGNSAVDPQGQLEAPHRRLSL